MNDVFDEIDACGIADEIKRLTVRHSDTYLVKKYWEAFKTARTASDPLEKAKALAKCRYINYIYSSFIPVMPGIRPFRAPHGFRGIAISTYARIGIGCTIFQNVTIGSNTLPDSKSAGFPVIGNHVYIGAGATIIGNVRIGNNARIGAGCFVSRDVGDNCTVVQAPPTVIAKNVPNVNRMHICIRTGRGKTNWWLMVIRFIQHQRLPKKFRLFSWEKIQNVS